MFKKHVSLAAVVVLLLIFVSNVSFAQQQEETKYGIGLQFSFPAWGLSGMIDLKEDVSIQGIFGLFGDLTTIAGRGLYRFRQEPYWNIYGYGMLGIWSYPYTELEGWSWEEKTETTLGFGVGVGIEYNWQAWDEELPPIWYNAEFGIGSVNFDKANYNFSTMMLGAGAHYKF